MTDWPPSTRPFRASPPDGSVGIALPIRNDLRFFKLCYHSLLAFTDYRHMLTVVDNESTIKTWQYLESIRRNHNINVLQFQKPHNLAAEWNLALRYMFAFSTVKYGVVLKPIIVFEPYWLSSTVRAVESSGVGIALPCTAEEETTDFMFFRREVFEALGGFNEDAAEPAKDFFARWIALVDRKAGGSTISPAFVHSFRNHGFDPKREEPATAVAQETTEAKA